MTAMAFSEPDLSFSVCTNSRRPLICSGTLVLDGTSVWIAFMNAGFWDMSAKACCSTPPADSRSNRSPVPCIRGLRATPGTRRKLQPSWRFDSVHTYRTSYPSFTGFSPCAHEDTEKRSFFFLKQCARKLHTAHKPRCASCLRIPARLARKTATTCCRIPPADSRSSRSPVP